jgi:hypothetical protein
MVKILVKEPGENLEIREVEDKLKSYQDIVGGYIETVSIAENLILVCNEEGLLLDLSINIVNGHPFCGTVFFVRTEGENFASLTDADIELISSGLFF